MYLAATNTLRAKAGTATAVTYTIFGDEVASGTDAYSPIAQGQIAASTTTIYTAPSSTQTIITEIQLANTTASPVTGITFYVNGAAATNQLNGGFTIPANGSAVYRKDNGITIYDSTGSSVAQVTILTGDVTGSGSGTIPTTLATVNASPGTTGSASSTSRTVVNAKGLVTSNTDIPIVITESQVTSLTSDLALKAPLISPGLTGTPTAPTATPGDSSTKLATTAYVDAAVQGTDTKDACVAATTGNLVGVYLNGSSGVGATFTYTATGTNVIDGITLTSGVRVLLKDQTSNFQNGIYTVTTVGSLGVAGVLTRATDFDQTADIDLGDSTFISSGTVNSNRTYEQNGTQGPVVGTDPITFALIGGPGAITSGNGITVTGLSVAIDTSVTVDKTTAQVLTNKDLSSGTNTFPTLNQNTTGSAAKLTTGRTISTTGDVAYTSPSFDGSSNVTAAATLATVNTVTPGIFGSATATPVITVNGKGLTTASAQTTVTPAVGSITGLGTGVATALGNNVGSAGAPVTFNGALGTPSSGTLTNATGLPTTGLTGVLQAAQEPAHTGDVTNSASSLAMSVVKVQGQSVSATTPTVGQVFEYGPSSTWTPSNLYFNVVSFGADPTGSANSATAIQSAINAAQIAGFVGGSGAIVWFPQGRYIINSTLTVTGHNITLMGAGGGQSLDAGNYYAGMASTLVPAAGIKAVVVSPVLTNGLSGVPNTGFKWKGLCIDGYTNFPTIGLQLLSCSNFDIDDYYSINVTDAHLDFNTLPAAALTIAAAFPLSAATLTVNNTAASGSAPAFASSGNIVLKDGTGTFRLLTYTGTTGTTFTGVSSGGLGTGSAPIGGFVQILPVAQDTTRGRVGQINVRALDGSGATGIGIRMNGDLGGAANTNLINFVGPLKIAHNTGIGIKDINSDTNYFDFVVINRVAGGTGIGAEIGAGSTNSVASRNNVFNHVSFGAGGLTARGTPTATFPSGPTRIMNYQLANGEVVPTVEAGALIDVNFNGAFKVGALTAPSLTTQTLTAATVNQLNNTKFVVPPNGFQVGAHLVWYVPITKTAVGTSWLFNVRYGTGAVSTGAILQTITYTATINIDGGILEVHSIISALGSGTSATNTGYAILRHDLAATGLSTGVTVPASDATGVVGFIYTRPTFAGFDSTLPNTGVPQFISLEINPVTAATVMTTQPGVQAFCLAQSSF